MATWKSLFWIINTGHTISHFCRRYMKYNHKHVVKVMLKLYYLAAVLTGLQYFNIVIHAFHIRSVNCKAMVWTPVSVPPLHILKSDSPGGSTQCGTCTFLPTVWGLIHMHCVWPQNGHVTFGMWRFFFYPKWSKSRYDMLSVLVKVNVPEI